MVLEKATAFATATERAAVAAATGGDPALDRPCRAAALPRQDPLERPQVPPLTPRAAAGGGA